MKVTGETFIRTEKNGVVTTERIPAKVSVNDNGDISVSQKHVHYDSSVKDEDSTQNANNKLDDQSMIIYYVIFGILFLIAIGVFIYLMRKKRKGKVRRINNGKQNINNGIRNMNNTIP